MKRHIPGKRWIVLAILSLLISYQKYNENELSRPENICARTLKEGIERDVHKDWNFDGQEFENEIYFSIFDYCSNEAKKVLFIKDEDKSNTIYIQASYKKKLNFDINLCRKTPDCKLVRFIEGIEFRNWLGDIKKLNFHLVIGGLQDRKATEYTWKGSKLITREVILGNFRPINLVGLKVIKQEANEIYFGNERSTENEAFKAVWHKFEFYFPNHYLKAILTSETEWTPYNNREDFQLRAIKVVSREETVYEPNDPHFIKILDQIVEKMCDKIGRFDLMFLPQKRINLGFQIHVTEKSCHKKPHQYLTTLYYPRDDDYPIVPMVLK
jgi:hypothetical protein